MGNTIQFQRYNMINKASQPGYVYLGKAFDFSGNSGDSNSCSDTHLFSSLVGSKNVRLNPIESSSVSIKLGCGAPGDCFPYEYFVEGIDILEDDVEFNILETPYHRFITLQSRWYYFRDINNITRDLDSSDKFSPNNFISSLERKIEGDYIVGWRTLTSDGSVLIKPTLDSKLFWNGSEYISDEEASHSFPEGFDIENQEYIYMKTLQYFDVVRSKTTEDSVGVVYKKYVDDCLSQNTILLKKLRGSNCLEVKENTHDVSISIKEDCDHPTDVIMDKDEFRSRVDMFMGWSEEDDELDLIENYRLALISLYDEESLDLSTMAWLEQFEYNFFNQLFNTSFTTETVISDSSQVDIRFNNKAARQNLYYGISPEDGIRKHHMLPSFFAYQNLYSVDHPDWMDGGTPYPRYTTRLTEVVTSGRITDGQKRVVVPPGAVFRTFKALPGFHSLYEKDALETLPDELHFAVDSYGNVLGERSLPSPGLARFVDGTEPIKSGDYDVVSKSQVDSLIEEMFDGYYTDNNRNFFDPNKVDTLKTYKSDNKMYYIATGDCKIHTYINLHHLPVWVELDVFCEYVGSYSDFMCLYQKLFAPVAFDDMTSPCYSEDDWNRNVTHSREVKDETYWNEIIKRYEIGNKVNNFEDDMSHWEYTGSELGNEE